MKHSIRMEWEPIEAEDHPGLWYVIEKIDGFPNRLRIGPMERDMIGLLIAERQEYHERLMEQVMDNFRLGIFRADEKI